MTGTLISIWPNKENKTYREMQEKMEAEIGAMLSHAKKCLWVSRNAWMKQRRILPWKLWREHRMATPLIQTYNLYIWKNNFCCLKPLSFKILLQRPWETNTRVNEIRLLLCLKPPLASCQLHRGLPDYMNSCLLARNTSPMLLLFILVHEPQLSLLSLPQTEPFVASRPLTLSVSGLESSSGFSQGRLLLIIQSSAQVTCLQRGQSWSSCVKCPPYHSLWDYFIYFLALFTIQYYFVLLG